MPSKVYTLTETNGRTGFVVGVFAERATALETARSWADYRLARILVQDEKTFGRPVEPGTYFITVSEPDEHASVTIIHRPSGEADDMAWQIWPFDVVEPGEAEDADAIDQLPQAA